MEYIIYKKYYHNLHDKILTSIPEISKPTNTENEDKDEQNNEPENRNTHKSEQNFLQFPNIHASDE